MTSSSSAPPAAPVPKKVKRWSCDAFLKAIEQVYPVEAQEPAGLTSSIKLRPYQKQAPSPALSHPPPSHPVQPLSTSFQLTPTQPLLPKSPRPEPSPKST